MNSETTPSAVFVRQVFHVTRDGITEQKDVPIRLTDDMRFAINVPDYVSNAINVPVELYGDSANDVLNKYEEVCDDYARWKLGSESKPMLRLRVAFSPLDGVKFRGIAAIAGMGLMPVWVVDKKDAGMFVFKREGDSLGHRTEIDPISDVLLADTPEIRQKIEVLTNTIAVASDILALVPRASDPAAYIMAIETDLSKTEPVQADTPPVVEDDDL